MKLKFRVTHLNYDGTSYSETHEVERDSCTIGRKGADIAIDDPCVSRRHAMLYQGIRGELRVMDLHSTNGTYLGDERVIDRQIGEGSILRVAGRAITVLEYVADRHSLGGNLAYDRKANEGDAQQTRTLVFNQQDLTASRSASGSGVSCRILPMTSPLRKA